MEEEWRWVKGFEGLYQISNYGRIKSYRIDKHGKILSVKNSKGWYLTVPIYDANKNRHTVRIHRVVAETFIGEIPDGYEIHHKDGNKQNNFVGNLEIIEAREHRILTMIENPEQTKGMNNYNKYERPKRIRQYTKDGYFVAEYANSAIASEFTGVCHRNILQVASKDHYNDKGYIRKQAGGYVWRFEGEEVT